MLETLGWILVFMSVPALTLAGVNRLWQSSRRRDRANVRRLQQYLDALPPARRWDA